MRIALLGPIGSASVARLLDPPGQGLPIGNSGAPILGTLIESLLRRGHRVDAFTIAYGEAVPPHGLRAQGPGFSICYLPGRAHTLRFSGFELGRALDACGAERKALVGALGRGTYDVIHAHWLYEYAAAALDQSSVPTVITAHDEPARVLRYMSSLYRLSRFAMAVRVLREAPQLTAVSPYLKQALSRYRAGEVHVVPNPLPPHVAACPGYARRLGPEDAIRVGMVLNGWSRLKNAKKAMRAFAAILPTLPAGSALQMIGADYAQGGPAQRWAEDKGIATGLQFLGELPHGAALQCIAEFHVLLNPSREESFGVVIAEAMALGIPVVAGRRSGAVPWLLANGAAGSLVDVESAESIAVGLLDCVQSLRSGDEVARDFARQRARNLCDADRVAAGYEAVYSQAIDPSRSVPPVPEWVTPPPPPLATVLHVLNELKASGAETMLRNAGSEWKRHGIRCQVLALGDEAGAFAPQLEAAGYRIARLPFAPRPGFLRPLVKQFRAVKPDVVHVHSERASFWVALAARLAGIPLVVRTIHSNFAFSGLLRTRRWATRLATRMLGVRQIAISEGVQANELERFGNRTVVLHNWFDSRRFAVVTTGARAVARQRLGLRADLCVLLTVGNCSVVKNHGALFEAIARLDCPGLIVLHAGAEEPGHPERRLVERLGLAPQVQFLGATDPLPLLQAADLFVMPSLYEGFSIAALEACATGTPALFADVPGLRDLALHFKASMFCPPSVDGLADALGRWLRSNSSALRDVASADALLAHSRFGMEQGVARYVALYGLPACGASSVAIVGTEANGKHGPLPAGH